MVSTKIKYTLLEQWVNLTFYRWMVDPVRLLAQTKVGGAKLSSARILQAVTESVTKFSARLNNKG